MSLKSEREINHAAKAVVARAKAALQSKNYDYFITLMQSALKEEPLFLDGRRYLRAGEIEKYRGLTSFNRQMLGMKVSTAAMKLSSAGKKEATEQLQIAEELLALDPFNNKANALVGEAGSKLGYPEFKAFAYETLAHEIPAGGKLKPADKSVLNTLAETYMELKDAVKAEKTYQRILEMDPRDGDALSGLKNASAAHASRSGGWEEKGNDYRNALKSKEESAEIEQASKVVKSVEAIDEQIQINYAKHLEAPMNPVFSRTIAQLFYQKNDLASAITWYEEAFNAGNKVDSSLEKMVGDLRLKLAEQELSQMAAEQIEEGDPDRKTQYLLALEQKQKEIHDARLAQAEARVRQFPNEGQYRYELGEALYHSGQYKRATEELQLGLRQPSVRYQALNYMGLSFMKRGMLDFAVKQLALAESELREMDDLKKEIVYNLGLAFDANKQPDRSLEQWKKIYEVDMSYRDVAARVEASYG